MERMDPKTLNPLLRAHAQEMAEAYFVPINLRPEGKNMPKMMPMGTIANETTAARIKKGAPMNRSKKEVPYPMTKITNKIKKDNAY